MAEQRIYYYLFCIINSNIPIEFDLDNSIGIKIYNIPYRNISAVVRECDSMESKADFDSLSLHIKVQNILVDDYVVLPMKYSTICPSKENIVGIMAQYYAQFESMIAELGNKVELGIKVFCNTDDIVQKYGEPEKIDTEGKSEALVYMLNKYSRFKRDKDALEQIKSILREMHRRCCEISSKSKINKSKTRNIILNSAYLVDRAKIEEFKQIVHEYKDRSKDYVLVFSGPWAPYNFVSIKQEGDLYV